jgi:hypothetical protein
MPNQPHLPCPNRTTRAVDQRPGPLGPCWRHSSFSQGADSTCVDVAVRNDQVLVRDSKAPTGPVLQFSFREWEVFLRAVRAQEFELPTPTGPDRDGHNTASRAEISS